MGNMIVSMGKKVIKQLTSIEYSLVFSRPHDGQVHVLSLDECLYEKASRSEFVQALQGLKIFLDYKFFSANSKNFLN